MNGEKTRLDFTGQEIDTILATVNSHLSFSKDQDLNGTDKGIARENIGAQSNVNALEVNPQELDENQRQQARSNIGAVEKQEGIERISSLYEKVNNKIDFNHQQDLTIIQKKQAQTNLGLHINEKDSSMTWPVGLDEHGKLWTYGSSISSWEEVGKILERGLAPEYWEPGDQLRVKKTIDSTTEELIFDILGFDYDTPIDSNIKHTMSLAMHRVYTYSEFAFDEQEAIFYFENGLPAGTYTFNYGGVDYFFVLSTRWSPNTQTVPGFSNELIPYIKGALNNSGEDSPTIYANHAEGISLGTVIDRNTSSSTILTIDGINYPVKMNAYDRSVLDWFSGAGSNRWETSDARQYLNSKDAGADPGQIASWWTPQTEFDRPTKFNRPGFLYGIEEEFLKLLVYVKKRTRLFNAGDVTGLYKDSDEKVFFLSQTEVGIDDEDYVGVYVYENSFGTDRTFTNILTKPYPLYVNATNFDRIKVNPDSWPERWWLRSPHQHHAGRVNYVARDGSLDYAGAVSKFGPVPALCIGR